MKRDHYSRRDFIKIGATAAAVGLMAPRAFGADEKPADKPELEYRILGRTGLKVTAVSIGCMTTPEEVIAKAFDMGVNYFDTARGYKNGKNEEEVARVVKGKRDTIYICTKVKPGSAEKMLADLEVSLEKLQTDHVDVLLAHSVSNREGILNEGTMAGLQKAKQSGKARFIGVSTHTNMAEVITALVEAKIYDVVLTTWNFKQGDELKNAIAKAKAANVGVIAMKTQAAMTTVTEGMSPHQAALKWALNNDGVACAIPASKNFQHLEQNMAVMGKKVGYLDRRRLEQFADPVAAAYCTGCGACGGVCPHGVSIPDVRRCAMYLDGYGDTTLARDNYHATLAKASPCGDCASCAAQCVHGVALQPVLARAHRLLA